MLNYLKPDRIECKDKMEKVLQQLQWPKFPGLHSLVVKVSFTILNHVTLEIFAVSGGKTSLIMCF